MVINYIKPIGLRKHISSLKVIEETETSERHSVNGYFGQRYAGAGLVLASIDYGGLTIEAD